jgi:hypothetical protein
MALTAASALTQASALLGHSYTYSITYPKSSSISDNGKYTFTVSNNSGVQPKFIFPSASSSFLYQCFGFEPDSTNTFSGNTLISTNVINLQAEDCIFIRSDVCTNPNDNVLQEIYANVASGPSQISAGRTSTLPPILKSLLATSQTPSTST